MHSISTSSISPCTPLSDEQSLRDLVGLIDPIDDVLGAKTFWYVNASTLYNSCVMKRTVCCFVDGNNIENQVIRRAVVGRRCVIKCIADGFEENMAAAFVRRLVMNGPQVMNQYGETGLKLFIHITLIIYIMISLQFASMLEY